MCKSQMVQGSTPFFPYKFGCLKFAFQGLQFLVRWCLVGPLPELQILGWEKCLIAQLPSAFISAISFDSHTILYPCQREGKPSPGL